MEVTIRAATIDDAAGVLGLWVDADAEPSHTDDLAGVATLLNHDPAALRLAEVEGRLVGSVIAAWDGWRGSIYRLAVDRRYRRVGIASRLLADAERHLATRGARRLQAIVVDLDNNATRFWRASQWHEQSERLRFVHG